MRKQWKCLLTPAPRELNTWARVPYQGPRHNPALWRGGGPSLALTQAWKIPWMEEPGSLQSMGWLRVGHGWVSSLSHIGEGNGNPLQCSCLENPRDRGAWWLPSVGSHRVGHYWSDLAAAAAGLVEVCFFDTFKNFEIMPYVNIIPCSFHSIYNMQIHRHILYNAANNIFQSCFPLFLENF